MECHQQHNSTAVVVHSTQQQHSRMSLSDVDLAPFLSDTPPVPHDVWIEADMCAVFDDVQMLLLQLPVDNSQLQKDATTTVDYLQCQTSPLHVYIRCHHHRHPS